MESHLSKKSRRRFLADMLFVGGGLTAAAILAKTQFLPDLPTPEPAIAGEMVAPAPAGSPHPLIVEKSTPTPVEPSPTRFVHRDHPDPDLTDCRVFPPESPKASPPKRIERSPVIMGMEPKRRFDP